MQGHGSHCGIPNTSTNNELSHNFLPDPMLLDDGLQPPSIFTQPPPYLPPSSLVIAAYNDLDPIQALISTFGSTTSSGSGGYESPISDPSCDDSRVPCPSAMKRSASSRSFMQKKVNESSLNLVSSPMAGQFLDLEGCFTRRVSSAGDLQGMMNNSKHGHRSENLVSTESSSIIESMSKARRYSSEEKKEKIERYRSKRNQRNFNKKIKYECRKMLADSRPRIRGRFARNNEVEITSEDQCNDQIAAEEYYNEDHDYWINLLLSLSPDLN